MAASAAGIGMMDAAYFVGRREILQWLNSTFQMNLGKIEETASGAVCCQVLDACFPGDVPVSKVRWDAKSPHEYIDNYKIIQSVLEKKGVDKHIEVERLMRGKYQDNLENMQWFKSFFGKTYSGQPYDPIARRGKGKGADAMPAFALDPHRRGPPKGDLGDGAPAAGTAAGPAGGAAGPAASSSAGGAAASSRKSGVGAGGAGVGAGAGDAGSRRAASGAAAAPPQAAAATGMRARAQPTAATAAASSAGGAGGVGVGVGIGGGGGGGLSAARAAELASQVEDLRLAVESLERERDFYFGKLRDVEVLLQQGQGQAQALAAAAGAGGGGGGMWGGGPEAAALLSDAVFAILYATDDDEFVPVDPVTGQALGAGGR